MLPLYLQARPVTAPAVTQSQNYTARPLLYVPSECPNLNIPSALCQNPGLKGTLGTWKLPSWSSLALWTSSCPILTITKEWEPDATCDFCL